jgi:hypothetical protein
MLTLLGIVAFVIGAAFFVGCAAIWYYMAKSEYREPFKVICPENLKPVEIRVDSTLAARSRFAGHEKIEVSSCSRWPGKADCGQECAPQVSFLGDDRRPVKYAAGGLPPQYLRINNPVQMTRDLYDRIAQQLAKRKQVA